MTISKPLPPRPSLESLRKHAKRLARDVAAGDAGAIARVRAQLPRVELPVTRRSAQLVIAREYGYAGWQDLIADVEARLGNAVAWAAEQARRAIHGNDVDQLRQLLTEYPALLSWTGSEWDDAGGLLGMATGAFADSFEPERERNFTRAASAELLIDAGAVVTPAVVDGLIQSRARGLLQLFHRKGLLPRTLTFFAALGDLASLQATLDRSAADLAAINEAFIIACRFEHEAVAAALLEHAIARDPVFGARIDAAIGRATFVSEFIRERSPDLGHTLTEGPWNTFVMARVRRAASDDDVQRFVRTLQQERWLLSDGYVWFQVQLIEDAALHGRDDLIRALVDLDPALLRRQPRPPSQAIEFVLTYAHTDLLPLLTPIWPLPDDLPHAAGTGNVARVMRWFDAAGAPALGQLDHHYPYNDPRARGHLRWQPPTAQQILDVALAFAVINRHFAIADFLLAHGADIDTNWNSHEPASILHHLVFEDNYESMQYLIDRGIDLTILDYRWNSTAYGWALHGKNDPKMAQWLEAAAHARSRSGPAGR